MAWPQVRKRDVKFADKIKDNEEEEHHQGRVFRYRRNELFDELVRQEKHKEAMVILQAFRYFVSKNLV